MPTKILKRKHPRVTVNNQGQVSLTKQAFKEECDINNIMNKYQKTGAIEHLNSFGGDYGFASDVDFTQSMLLIKKAENMFANLPSTIRAKFNNDPSQFLEYTSDENNHAEMVTLGLRDKTDDLTPPMNKNPVVEEPTPLKPKESDKKE